MKLKATSDGSTVVDKNTVEYEFTVAMVDGCLLDVLSDPSTIANFAYYIDDTGLYTVPAPTYT